MRYSISIFLRQLFSGTTLRSFFSLASLQIVLSILGGIWLITQIISIYWSEARTWLQTNIPLWVLILIAVLPALYFRFPRTRIVRQIDGTDIRIEVVVADIIGSRAAAVVPCNTTFDTDINSGIISPGSIQGQFTRKYYNNVAHLDTDLNQALASEQGEDLQAETTRRGKKQRYKIGIIARTTVSNRNLYWLAMAHINEHGNATSNVTMITDSLVALWQYLAEKGSFEDVLCIPVLGTGASRIQRTREEIIRLIIDSFIAGCTAQKVCNCLRICIGPRDFQTLDIDLAALEQYLTVRCRYANFLSKLDTGAGVPV